MLKIHTFELRKIVCTNDEFTQIRYNLKDVGHRYRRTETSQTDIYYLEKGVVVFLIRCRYASNIIIMQITPQKVLNEEQESCLLELNEKKFMKCLESVGKALKKNQIRLTEFRISRIDFTQDIRFEKSEIIDIYIRLLNKAGAPYRYGYKKYKDTKYKDSYEITNGFHSIAVYNKEQESKQRNKRGMAMNGIMRTEVRMSDTGERKGLFLAETLEFDKIIAMRENADNILKYVFTEGFYIKLEKTKTILYKEYCSKNTMKRRKNKLEKMIELSETVAIHRSAYDCIRGTNAVYSHETVKDIIGQFEKERINLIAISAKEHISVLPDMKYILGIKTENEVEKDNQFLTKNNLMNKIPKFDVL
ncbi:hypothetical protein FMM75_17980 [Lachnospiraceae bacterium MD335]|jgi:hypothetical protein|nr:hypothetical protein C809_00939 [Lachnospiraceae bacterium MD335]NDO51216.1 hypothetical protein [Lachnospiraceae bacterium MD335]